ncbi:response regulator [Mucilaginibacter conchicola]|uniref:Response regulator n=1 Tax=Mucilaginibacter conchicola TaxID=2303333 RepID=A0A372NY77_9SPHI|nr:response regulator [Mucilaginibacter conchicola]
MYHVQNLVIIDDDPFFHFIIKKLMNRHTSSTTVTYSWDVMSVIDFLRNNYNDPLKLPDFIFVDLNMPVFSGWDFMKLYNDLHKIIYKTIKIYVVSSSIDPNNMRKALSYPFISNYIIKPISSEKIEEILTSL